VIRLVTQFDPPGTHATEAAIPGGCCSCSCCCCCLATIVSVSAVAAIQASRKASEAPQRPAGAGLWVGLAASALFAAAIVAGGVAWASSGIASSSSLPIAVFGLGTLTFWGTLLWAAFRGVGFANPVVRAVAFVLIGVVAFVIEAFAGAALVINAWPVYLIGAAGVIAFVIWRAWTPIVNFSDSDNSPRP